MPTNWSPGTAASAWCNVSQNSSVVLGLTNATDVLPPAPSASQATKKPPTEVTRWPSLNHINAFLSPSPSASPGFATVPQFAAPEATSTNFCQACWLEVSTCVPDCVRSASANNAPVLVLTSVPTSRMPLWLESILPVLACVEPIAGYT